MIILLSFLNNLHHGRCCFSSLRDLSGELLLLLQVEEIEFLYSSKDLKKIICAYDNTALKYFLIILKFKWNLSAKALFSKLYFSFPKNFNYCKSYHGKTKILKICPFSKKFPISSPCYNYKWRLFIYSNNVIKCIITVWLW